MRLILYFCGVVLSTAAGIILVWAATVPPAPADRPVTTAALSDPEPPDATLLAILAENTGKPVVAMDPPTPKPPLAKKAAAKRVEVADKSRCSTVLGCSKSRKGRGAESAPPQDEYPGGLASLLNAAQRDLQQLAQNLRSGPAAEPAPAR